jgi:hypothetical protein
MRIGWLKYLRMQVNKVHATAQRRDETSNVLTLRLCEKQKAEQRYAAQVCDATKDEQRFKSW